MALITMKTIVFQNEKKKTFQLRNFVPFFVCLLPGLVNKRLKMALFCQGTVSKGIGVTKSNVLKEFVMTLRASRHGFFTNKSKLIFDFCHN